MEIRYRRDIDGLRTVAVLPVVLFHAGLSGLDGGFVGVDVFFVISGFLITGIIAREVNEQRFSILRFYERRVRRIVPALFAMIAAVLAAAAWLYFPEDFANVGQSVVAALLFVSNLNFWHEADYFGPTALTQPMLHTWSLAVEEQYYIVFPLLLLVIARRAPRLRTPALWAMFVGSLAFCIWQTRAQPDAAFYLPFARVWELAAGALLAVGAIPAARSPALREAIATAGLLAIGVAVFTFNSGTPFPGVAALLPVLGAAALLHSAPDTFVGRLLSLRPVVGIGLISYSLYLWHWPIIVFTRYAQDGILTPASTAGVIVASFIFAWLSWRFVERPFRDRTRMPMRRVFTQAAIGAVVLGGVSVAVLAGGGLPGRIRPDVLRLVDQEKDVSPLRTKCHVNGARDLKRPPCTIGANVPPTALIWGDSHAVELAYAVGEQARTRGHAVLEGTSSSCLPLPSLTTPSVCTRHNRAMLALLAARPQIGTVVLSGYWANAKNDQGAVPGALLDVVAKLRALGRRVIVVGDAPPQESDVPRRLAHLAGRGRLDQQSGTTRTATAAMTAYLDPAVAQLRADGVTIVNPQDILCHGDRCDTYRDGHALYFDHHHMSLSGARLVAAPIAAAIFDSPATPTPPTARPAR